MPDNKPPVWLNKDVNLYEVTVEEFAKPAGNRVKSLVFCEGGHLEAKRIAEGTFLGVAKGIKLILIPVLLDSVEALEKAARRA
jgi:hypothetical protein